MSILIFKVLVQGTFTIIVFLKKQKNVHDNKKKKKLKRKKKKKKILTSFKSTLMVEKSGVKVTQNIN